MAQPMLNKFYALFIATQSPNILLNVFQNPVQLVNDLSKGETNATIETIKTVINATLPCMVNETQKFVNDSKTFGNESIHTIASAILENW